MNVCHGPLASKKMIHIGTSNSQFLTYIPELNWNNYFNFENLMLHIISIYFCKCHSLCLEFGLISHSLTTLKCFSISAIQPYLNVGSLPTAK